MFFLIQNLTKDESRVIAQHHDWQAISDVNVSLQTIGRYEFVVVSDEFTLDDPALQEEKERQEEQKTEEQSASKELDKRLVDPDSFDAFRFKSQYCDAEVQFLINVFSSSFTVADVKELLNESLKEHFSRKKSVQALPKDEIEKLLPPSVEPEDE